MWRLVVVVLMLRCSAAWCPRQCSCGYDVTDRLEVFCPASESSARIVVNIDPDVVIRIRCNNATSKDWGLIGGVRTNAVPFVDISQCPTPPTNFSQSINVSKVRKFIFSSFKNLSNNFQSDFFAEMSELEYLDLHSNGFTDLPDGLFDTLTYLQKLSLRDNHLRAFTKKLFKRTLNLTWLELGNNVIEQLEPGIMQNLAKLQLLNLWGNKLEILKPAYFAGLKNLSSLDVHSNKFSYLKGEVFQELVNLKEINLSGNNFSEMETNLFKSTPLLEVVRLTNNRRKLLLPSGFLSGLSSLKAVYLGGNGIESLPIDLFYGSAALLNISLQNNAISEIPSKVFRDQHNLERLDLSRNEITNISSVPFQKLVHLTHLSLNFNRLTVIQKDTFKGLEKLVQLDLDHNQLTIIHDVAFFPLKRLRRLQLSHNFLSFLDDDGHVLSAIRIIDSYGNSSPLRHCLELEDLRLANNSIREMFQDWRYIMLNLKTLDLSYNNFTSLNGGDLIFLSNNDMRVDLRHNSIEQVDQLWVVGAGGEPPPGHPVPKVLLSSNPINCDCISYDLGLYSHYQLPSPVYGRIRLEMDELRCASPARLQDRLLSELPLSDYVCDLTGGCPSRCHCYFRKYDKALVVNCSNLGLAEAPEILPMLQSSNHTELLLDHNHLTNFPNTSLPTYSNVTHLSLSYNRISNMSSDLVSMTLRMLLLDHNNLTTIEATTLKKLNDAALKQVTLHGNPWKCDCSNRDLLVWIQPQFKKILFFNNITCSDSRKLSALSIRELCPERSSMMWYNAILIGVTALVIVCCVLYYNNVESIKVWMFAHQCCLCLVTEEELDKDKRFDAFVSFSHKDEQFVVEELVPRLEASGLTLCLHYRDWVAGEWIPNQIARSVDASRRTLVVLSPNFIESVWGRMEFRVAHKQALSEGRARVVMLIYGELPSADQLDPELNAYINMNTYVKWGDPWFWDKLRYALPHAPLPVQKTKKLDERIELMNSGTPATTPTTPVHNGLPPLPMVAVLPK